MTFDLSITLGNILTIIMIFAGIVGLWIGVTNKITLLIERDVEFQRRLAKLEATDTVSKLASIEAHINILKEDIFRVRTRLDTFLDSQSMTGKDVVRWLQEHSKE